jgi:hypothetical protein
MAPTIPPIHVERATLLAVAVARPDIAHTLIVAAEAQPVHAALEDRSPSAFRRDISEAA